MKKIILIISILILFVAACSTSTSKKTTKDIDVRTGLSALTLEYLKNTPPQRIFEGDKFPVTIRIKNTGATDIKDNQAVLSLGIEKDYTKSIQLLPSSNVQLLKENAATFNLEGKSKVNQKGGEEVISYNLIAGKVDPQSEFHSSTVIATLCYPYQTILDTTVCVDTDVNNLRPGKKVCKLQDLIFNNGQGALVAITKIEVQMLPSQASQQSAEGYGTIVPQFLIFIENKGQGTVIKNDAIKEFCTQGKISHEKFNTIFVKAFLRGEELDCEPKEKRGNAEKQGYVKLKDKKDLIRCTLRNGLDGKQDSYLSPLKIELSYGYTQSISASYFIQKTAR